MNQPRVMSRYLILFVFAFPTLVHCQRVGNPDDTARIERPCSVFNHNCIRKYFSEHAHCRLTQGPIPDPYIRPQVNLFIPRTNMTITIINQVISASNARIEEFYINRDTDKMVMAIEFRNLSQASNETYFRFHRRAKEPVVTIAAGSVNYQSVVITAVIPYIDDLQLKKAECTAFSNDSAPPTVVGPTAAESSDPQVQVALTAFLADLPNNVQEIFLTDAAFYAALPQVNLFIPRTNMTITIINQVISASNARIEEFYINRDTDKMVMAIEFRNLSQASNETYFRFHRRAKEPVVTIAAGSVNYQSVVITAVIPYIDDLQLKKAECTAFSNDSAPPTVVGPTAAESSDPQVQVALTAFLADLPNNVQEIFLTDAAFYAALFIQYNICDFGLLLI